MEVTDARFWVSVFEIIWINILLSGDNAIVIALACRRLKPGERFWGMVIGAGVAAILLIVFTGIVASLMTLPYLKIVGAFALLWIAIQLLKPPEQHSDAHEHAAAARQSDDSSRRSGKHIEAGETLWRAIRIVVIADLVMSLDNVIAVAGAAKGNYALLTLGLAISIPIVIAGSAIIMALLLRFPFLVWLGAALLGSISGELFATDPTVSGGLNHLTGLTASNLERAAAIIGAMAVVLVGAARRRSSGEALDRV